MKSLKKNNQNTCIHMNNIVICCPESEILIVGKNHKVFEQYLA